MNSEQKNIDLSLLSVNIENPRFEMVGSQREAISHMIDDQGQRLSKLAQDILDNGLNPSDLIIVTKHEKSEGHYNVLEGNRRITALKLLANPDLIPDKHKSLLNTFKKLSERFYLNPISELPCVVFDDEQLANRWIKLKHTGANDGIGVVSWDAQQKARFEERVEGKSSYALQVIDFLGKQEIEDDLKKNLNKLPSSSVQRLVTDPDFRNVVGLDIKDGKLYTKLPQEEVTKPLVKMAKDLLRDDFTVKEIYYKDDRLNYIETFKTNELPNKSTELSANWELTTPNPPQKPKEKPTNNKSKSKSSKLSTARNTIIPKSCILHINQTRINKIYRELKDLDLRDFCNCGAITFRVFIELSIDYYIEEKGITGTHKNDKLRKKVTVVTDYMDNNSILDKDKLKGIRNALGNNNHILSIDTFNAYVHNKHLNPTENDLKLAWDNIEHFVLKLWE